MLGRDADTEREGQHDQRDRIIRASRQTRNPMLKKLAITSSPNESLFTRTLQLSPFQQAPNMSETGQESAGYEGT